MQRLSSGLRINSAADDAAGLAISQQFTTQINGTNQASTTRTTRCRKRRPPAARSTTIVNNLQSIRTLAVESANGSNSASDRAALDQQVQQQIAEITQIASQTTFNGLNVLERLERHDDLPGRRQRRQHDLRSTCPGRAAPTRSAQVASTTNGRRDRRHQRRPDHCGRQRHCDDHRREQPVCDDRQLRNGRRAYAYQDASSAYAKAPAINGAGISGLTASRQQLPGT